MFGGGFDDGSGMGQFGGGDTQFGGGQFGADNFGGAQFGNNNASQGGGFETNNSGPDGKQKNLNKQSLIPCTIKQLKNAPAQGGGGDNSFAIDGQELHQVTIVGLITNADEQNTNLQYTIDDGTGSIVAKMWIDSAQDEAMAEKRALWREGKVVRVIGQMRAFNQVRSVVAFHIQPLTDMNEYSFHFIECVHTHLRNTKGRPQDQAGGAAPAGGMGMGGGAQFQQGMSMGAPGMGGGAVATGAGAPGMGGAGFAPQAQVPVSETVLKYFTSYGADNDVGCTVEACATAMAGSGTTVEQVRAAVEQLVNDGHLYSTIDDDHFKSTA